MIATQGIKLTSLFDRLWRYGARSLCECAKFCALDYGKYEEEAFRYQVFYRGVKLGTIFFGMQNVKLEMFLNSV